MLLRVIIDDHYHAEGIENVWARHRTLSAAVHAAVDAWARKRHFLSHLYIKCIILPRQARDEHREKHSKKVPFSQASGDGVLKANMDEPSERSVRTLSPPSPHIHI
eukprot:COSAG06_NODE_12110_length_1422_cov_2.312295_1_plen_106_part_00